MREEPLLLSGRSFRSRLIVGSSDYPSLAVMRRCHDAAGAELVTVAVRKVDLAGGGESVLDHVDQGRVTLLPSTEGCRTAEEAVRTAFLGREAGLGDLVKVEVLGDERTLWPDAAAVLEATKNLAREGFVVLPAGPPDPVLGRRLEEVGAAGVMAMGAPAGSGLGIRSAAPLRLLVEALTVPVIVDGGVGTASDAAIAMELGCHGVSVGSAIARASDPEGMAEAMKLAVQGGRLAHRAGRVARRLHASAWGVFEGLPQ